MPYQLPHSLIGNALNVTYGGVTHLTHVLVALHTWKLGHLVICGCWREVGANVSMLNRLVVIVVDEGRRWHIITRLHDRREIPMLGHLPWMLPKMEGSSMRVVGHLGVGVEACPWWRSWSSCTCFLEVVCTSR